MKSKFKHFLNEIKIYGFKRHFERQFIFAGGFFPYIMCKLFGKENICRIFGHNCEYVLQTPLVTTVYCRRCPYKQGQYLSLNVYLNSDIRTNELKMPEIPDTCYGEDNRRDYKDRQIYTISYRLIDEKESRKRLYIDANVHCENLRKRIEEYNNMVDEKCDKKIKDYNEWIKWVEDFRKNK